MRRPVVLLWIALAVALLLVLPELAVASEDDVAESMAAYADSKSKQREDVAEEDEEWEEFEDDDEVSLAAASSKAANRAVKALPKVTDQNADRILSSTEYVLLMGYASWCKQSAAVMIDFAEAATVLAAKGSPAVFAKVDAIANPVTANRYNIKGYPTIIFLVNGSTELYTAGQTRDDFVNWVLKKTGRPAETFTTRAEAKELQSRDATVVIGFFEKFEGPEYEEFVAASNEVFDVAFLQTTNPDAVQVFSEDFAKTAPAIAVWKSVPEKFLKYGGELKRAEIVPFLKLNKFALVTKLQARNARKVYASPVNKQVLLFANSYDYDSIYPFYLAAAKYFKGELFFAWVDIEDEEFAKPMTTMYGIMGSEPAVAGFDNSNGSKYLLDSEVSKQSLKAFVINYKEGRLKLHHKSEPIPKKNKGDVKIVVGKTFDKLVLKSSKDVLLLISTTYCYDCESVAKSFARLAKHYKGQMPVVFAKVDATLNDHPALQVQNYPTILLYRASSKGSPPVEAPQKPNFKKLVQFMEEQGLGIDSTGKEDTSPEAQLLDTQSFSIPIGSLESELKPGSENIARPDSESEVQSAVEEVEVLLAGDIIIGPTVTTLEAPKGTNSQDEATASEPTPEAVEEVLDIQSSEVVGDHHDEL